MDGRLLPPAVAAWLGALGAGLLAARGESDRHGHAMAIATVVVVALLVLGAAALAVRVNAFITPSRTVALTLAALLIGALSGALHAASLASEPLASWVDARATATVEGVVEGEPVRRMLLGAAPWQASSRLEVPLDTRRVAARGMLVDVDVPLVLQVAEGRVVPPPGSVVVVTGRLAPLLNPADSSGALVPTAEIAVIDAPGWLDTWAQAMRTGLQEALVGTSPDAGALVAGLAVGDESLQSEQLDAAMRASGLSHLTAVSGGNVAIIVVAVVAIVTLLGLSLWLRVTAALIALGLFVVLVGPQPSVLRAAVMGGVVITALLVGGRRAGPSVLAASVLVLVIVSPSLALSWAFALSVAATGGLVLLAPRLRAAIDKWPRARRWPLGLRDAVAITVAAQLATVPVLVLMGATTGWVALPANLLAMPVVPAVTILGLLAAIASPVAPAVAHLLAVAASWPAGWIATVAEVGSALPLAVLPWPSGPPGVLALLLAGVGVGLGRRWARTAFPQGVPRVAVACGLAILVPTATLWLIAPPDRRSWPPANWVLIACDVGQGDALLLRSGEAAAVVVDVGPDPDLVDGCLADAGIREVPAIVLTHFHADHVDGLSGVLRGRDIGVVYVSPVADPPEQASEVGRLLTERGIAVVPVVAGEERRVGDVQWRVLWPRRVITSGSIPNNASLVLAVDVAGRTLLLTGDVERPAQSAILPDLLGRRFDVVKVPHHGSRDQDPRLAPATRPALTLISVGEGNTYGHPAAETVAAWQAVGALVARTDRDGDIAVVTTAEGVGLTTRS